MQRRGRRNIYFHGKLFSTQFTLDPILVKQCKEITDLEMVVCPFCSVDESRPEENMLAFS